MTFAQRSALVVSVALSLAACQTAEPSIRMEPGSAALVTRMHPDIRGPFSADYIQVIVKGTSAAAIEQGCRGQMRVKSEYRTSLQLVLRSNDIEFGQGTSRREVAKKAQEHRVERDCAALASRLNTPGGYENLFLERLR
jgi:hypothetical protein